MNYKLVLEKALQSTDQPNLILYGNHTINKLNILKEYLQVNEYLTEMIQNDISYLSNNSLKLFDMSYIKKSKISSFFTLISEIVKCKNYYIDDNRILILYNFNHVHREIQDRFRVIFEKYRKNTVFIIITDNINSVSAPIISRFLPIRITDIHRDKKIALCYPIIKDLTYDKRCIIYDKIYQLSDENTIMEYSKHNYGLLNNYDDIIKYIYLSIKDMKSLDKSLDKSLLKEYAYMIEKYHIQYFHSELLKIMIEDSDIYEYQDIIKTITDCEMRYKKSFNRILSNEYLLMFIYEKTRSHSESDLTGRKEVNRNKEE
jgi:hypothetical protein